MPADNGSRAGAIAPALPDALRHPLPQMHFQPPAHFLCSAKKLLLFPIFTLIYFCILAGFRRRVKRNDGITAKSLVLHLNMLCHLTIFTLDVIHQPIAHPPVDLSHKLQG